MGQEQSAGQRPSKPSEAARVGKIVVVKSGKSNTKDQQIDRDPDLMRLRKITTFSPLVGSSLQNPAFYTVAEFDIANRLDARCARMLCSRYERHLKLRAEAVAFDQDAITNRLKELDQRSSAVLRAVSERHKRLQSQLQLIATVEDVKRNIDRIEKTLQGVIPLMEELNELLPEGEKMEPFLKT